jgi:hypothetical protein
MHYNTYSMHRSMRLLACAARANQTQTKPTEPIWATPIRIPEIIPDRRFNAARDPVSMLDLLTFKICRRV